MLGKQKKACNLNDYRLFLFTPHTGGCSPQAETLYQLIYLTFFNPVVIW